MAEVSQLAPKRNAATPDWLETTRLGFNDWRVSDSRIEPSEPTRLLGYIERLGRHRYEILWMSEPVGWAYVTTLRIALHAFANEEPFDGIIATERDPAALSATTISFRRKGRRTPANRPAAPRAA